MKEYRYRATAGKLIYYLIFLLFGLYIVFFATINTDGSSKHDELIIRIFFAILMLGWFIYTVEYVAKFVATNIKAQKIIVKEDRVLIPNIYSGGHTAFYFENITQVERRINRYRYETSRIIYIESGKAINTVINGRFLESVAVFNELYSEIRIRVDSARKNIPKQVEVDNEHQPYKRKITFESKFHRKRF